MLNEVKHLHAGIPRSAQNHGYQNPCGHPLLQIPLDLHVFPSYALCFIPMKLNSSDSAIGKPNVANAFEFAPTPTSVDLLQVCHVADA